jgi:ABC-type transport system substrate-binding protein
LLQGLKAVSGSLFDAAPVGTGPYRVVGWHHGDAVELEANPNYFRGAPRIARLRIEFVPSAQTIAARLQTGETDAYLAADPFMLSQLRANRRLRLDVMPIYGFVSLSMQTKDPALRDPDARRALARAFDFNRDVAVASHGILNARDAGRGLFTWAYVPHRIPPSSARLPSDLTLSIIATRPIDRALAVIMQQEARRVRTTLAIRAYAP